MRINVILIIFFSFCFAEAKIQNYFVGLFDDDDTYYQIPNQPFIDDYYLFFISEDCQLKINDVQKIIDFKKILNSKNAKLYFIDASYLSSSDKNKNLILKKNKHEIFLNDRFHHLVRKLNVKYSGELLHLKKGNLKVQQRTIIDNLKLRETLSTNFLNARPKASKKPHCEIKSPEPKPFIASNVAKIIKERCLVCHNTQNAEINFLDNIKSIRSHLDSIENQLIRRTMPPSPFARANKNIYRDVGLSDKELSILTEWVYDLKTQTDSSYLKNLSQILNESSKNAPPWIFGNPESIVSLPPQKILEKKWQGYRYLTVPLKNSKRVWITGYQWKFPKKNFPHHIRAKIIDSPPKHKMPIDLLQEAKTPAFGWAPGHTAIRFSEGYGIKANPDSYLAIEIHYEPDGREKTSFPEVGLYFSESPLKDFHYTSISKMKFSIPPQSVKSFASSRLFKQGGIVGHAYIHGHFRAQSGLISYKTPQGKVGKILEIPRYSFKQQNSYHLKTAINVPPNSEINCEITYNNTDTNSLNPNPLAHVKMGLRATDEMLMCGLLFKAPLGHRRSKDQGTE